MPYEEIRVNSASHCHRPTVAIAKMLRDKKFPILLPSWDFNLRHEGLRPVGILLRSWPASQR